jgi:hypothetical protein
MGHAVRGPGQDSNSEFQLLNSQTHALRSKRSVRHGMRRQTPQRINAPTKEPIYGNPKSLMVNSQSPISNPYRPRAGFVRIVFGVAACTVSRCSDLPDRSVLL